MSSCSVAFTTPLPLGTSSLFQRHSICSICIPPPQRRRRVLHSNIIRSSMAADAAASGFLRPGEPEESEKDKEYSLFVDEDEGSFWENINVSTTFAPLAEEEKEMLRKKLPKRIANFLIRRAEDAVRLRDSRDESGTMLAKVLSELPPDEPDLLDDFEAGFVFETVGGAPTFRYRGSSLFGGGDGLPDIADEEEEQLVDGQPKPKLMSMFVGRPSSVSEQASSVGYSILAFLAFIFVIKMALAFISFFVSFTFSFFAIFALSAGIFMVFFFLRF